MTLLAETSLAGAAGTAGQRADLWAAAHSDGLLLATGHYRNGVTC
jgi:hypothetical protein